MTIPYIVNDEFVIFLLRRSSRIAVAENDGFVKIDVRTVAGQARHKEV
jgi:hypothetical protein